MFDHTRFLGNRRITAAVVACRDNQAKFRLYTEFAKPEMRGEGPADEASHIVLRLRGEQTVLHAIDGA